MAALLDDVPFCITRIRSASTMVDSRWAMTKLVRPFIRVCMALPISISVRVSTLEVASSRIRHRRIAEHDTGNGQKLALAHGDVLCLVVQNRIVPMGHGPDKEVHPRRLWPRLMISSRVASGRP